MFIFVGFVISCRLRIDLEIGSQNQPGKSLKQNGEGPFSILYYDFSKKIVLLKIIDTI